MTIRANGDHAQLVFRLDGLFGEHQFQQVGNGPRRVSTLPHGFHDRERCTIADDQLAGPGNCCRAVSRVDIQARSRNWRVTNTPWRFPRHPTGGAHAGHALIVLSQHADGVVPAFGAVQAPQS